MENTIELKKANGEIIKAELISYFQLVTTNKKYIFYTMNETVENGLVKMYVSEVIDSAGLNLTEKMTDEEWTNLKGIMKSILTGNENTNIKYLNVEE
jgi:hypothetical protein